MKNLLRQFRYSEKGFTLIELLVVIAILGVLSAIGAVNFSKFIGTGKTESYGAELHNVQTAVEVMLADSTAGVLDSAVSATDDMGTVTTDSGAKKLSDYLTGLDASDKTKSGCTYEFEEDGTVTQKTP